MIKNYIKSCIKSLDPVLFICTVLLSAIGIITILGQVDSLASGKRTLIMQIAMTVAGIVFTLIIANIDYHRIVDKLWVIMIIASAGILLVTLIFGNTGADRVTTNRSWLTIPFVNIAIQPSEFVKIAMVCSFGKHISLVKDRINRPKELGLLLLHALGITGLILISGDLGVALVYVAFILIMLYCAGLSPWYIIGALGVIVLASPLALKFLNEYQIQRLLVGFNPESDPLGYGMQPLTSKACIENGGFFGVGLFNDGIYQTLPASHTDFIFATSCEKMGMFMGIIIMALLLIMVLRIFYIARSCGKDYGAYMCIGVGAILLVQTVENIGMCLAMLPVIGITLPFVSYGGSSILAVYVLVALVHSVKTHHPKGSLRKYF
ncbi:MAG: hypothetical protein E7667_02660 [Ruminococcaceae bacterium]|nr:hypothetical protein [Oscillospiraceae bacterium]